MARATQTLGQVNYAGLSNDMKAQFDTANRFLALAEQALKEGNLLFASTLTDKAGAIASACVTGRSDSYTSTPAAAGCGTSVPVPSVDCTSISPSCSCTVR